MKERGSDRIEFLNSNGSGELFDLSCTGVAFLYSNRKTAGEMVNVQINDLKVQAKVIYCQERTDGYRLGLHFENMNSSSIKSMNELVEKFSKGVPISCRVTENL